MDSPAHRPQFGRPNFGTKVYTPQSMCSIKPEGVDSWEWWKSNSQYNTQLIPRLIFFPTHVHFQEGCDHPNLSQVSCISSSRSGSLCFSWCWVWQDGPEMHRTFPNFQETYRFLGSKSWVFDRFLPKPIPTHKHLLDHYSKQQLAYFDFQISQLRVFRRLSDEILGLKNPAMVR